MYGYSPQFILRLTFSPLLSSPLLFSLVENLQSLSDEGWTVFVLQLCSSLEEQNPSLPLSSSSTAAAHTSTATRSKLNLLCYLCCVARHEVIANRLINSALVRTFIFSEDPCWNIATSLLARFNKIFLQFEGDFRPQNCMAMWESLILAE